MAYLLAIAFTVFAGTNIYEVETGEKWNCDENPKMECVYDVNE